MAPSKPVSLGEKRSLPLCPVMWNCRVPLLADHSSPQKTYAPPCLKPQQTHLAFVNLCMALTALCTKSCRNSAREWLPPSLQTRTPLHLTWSCWWGSGGHCQSSRSNQQWYSPENSREMLFLLWKLRDKSNLRAFQESCTYKEAERRKTEHGRGSPPVLQKEKSNRLPSSRDHMKESIQKSQRVLLYFKWKLKDVQWKVSSQIVNVKNTPTHREMGLCHTGWK